MSVIIRLQNLPWSANALDIRQFFSGLSIPEGGVHIVGGELGDAFIAFSTDEDARQAFSRNNGKIKEVQITLMLSSRTEMQRVIEAARAQSYAAFMQAPPAAVPLPAVVPPVIPSAIPEIKKETKDGKIGDKKDGRRRSRSKSRERKDRSRERDRKDKRHRDRSRSRSRERKERRRRDRSRSRGRSRSRDRDRRTRDHRKRSEEKPSGLPFQRDPRKPLPEVWANQSQPKNPMDVIGTAQASSILGSFPVTLDQAKRNINTLTPGLQPNGFPANNGNNFNVPGRMRDSWPPVVGQNFQGNNRPMDNPMGKRGNASGPGNQDHGFPNRFQRNFQKGNDGPRGRMNNDIDDNLTDCCVSLEPFYGGYGEVRRFFQGLFISNKGIKFINDSNGRRTGIVYIQFANQKSKEDALMLNRKILNNIQVSVSHVSDIEFETAVDRFTPMINLDDNSNDSGHNYKRTKNMKYFNNAPPEPEAKDFSCLTVEDLPTYCKEQDILHIFSQHPLVALILTTRPRGGHIAYVKFSSKDVAKKAYEEKNHHVVGGKQVTVKPCKDEDFEEINKVHEVDLTGDKNEAEDVGTDCLSVSRLPPKTSDKDIADFFSDIGVIPTKIHLMSNNLGFTGQAYCEFASSDEATRAAKKDDTMLGKIHISVKPLSRDDMTAILGHTVPAPPIPPTMDMPTALPAQKKLMPGPNNAGVDPSLNSPNNTANPMPPNPEFMGPMGGHPMNRPFFRNFDNNGPRGGPRFGPRGMGPRGPRFGHNNNMQQMEHFEEAPQPGCTVYMKNVPYKAGTNDILDFFDGYNITNNVSRRYNPNNTPSDEAKVVFFDPDDAFRAVQELHMQKIWDRQIFLRQE